MNSKDIIERERPYIEEIANKYNYDSNITHLLYLMIPAFIIKYGVSKEKLILNTFKDIRIMSSNKENKVVTAYYSSTPIRVDNEIKTKKIMVIQNYNNIGLVDLLDNLVHEFNHAINSYINEIKETKNYIYLRTGLTYRIFRKDDFSFVKKESSYILEEIINTKQTSDIINIIKTFDKDDNTIYAINSETNDKYNSNSYYLQSYVCKEILNNRTFISTLESLRINGEVDTIENWFNDIAGENSYKELINYLIDIYNLEIEYSKRKLFKSILIGKIKDMSRKIMRIVDKFNNNVNFR